MSTAANVLFTFSALLTIVTSLSFIPYGGQEDRLANADTDLEFYQGCSQATLAGVEALEARVDIAEIELETIQAGAAVLQISNTGTNKDSLTITVNTLSYGHD